MPRPRIWTDEQLKEAVAVASTWGEVVNRVGLADYGTTRRTLQGHVVRLGLDAGHLPPFKPVPPRYPSGAVPIDSSCLAAAVANSTSWAGVLRLLGTTQSGSAQARLRQQANALGLDITHFRGQAWGSSPVDGVSMPFSREPAAKFLHKAATARATAWFMERGYTVCVPVEPALYDLVVDSDEGLMRIQVKSTGSNERSGRWVVRTQRLAYDHNAKRTANGARTRCIYAPGEIDFFFIVTASGDNYLIPLSVTNGSLSLTLDSKYAAFKI